jgi:hypothetical protein
MHYCILDWSLEVLVEGRIICGAAASEHMHSHLGIRWGHYLLFAYIPFRKKGKTLLCSLYNNTWKEDAQIEA